jgi:4-amino-4-deoxy-L-arabinose transferase-like glycosyltransferase
MKISKNKVFLFLIVVLAFTLRIIAAHHIHVSTDEMIYSIMPLNIISAGRLGTIEQSPLAFYLADIGYNIFGGISAINVRLHAIIFGTLAVVVIYLICKELWSKKVGLISSFLFATSGYAISFNYETDMMAYFFSILAIYFFIKYLKTKKNLFLYATAIAMGLGILAKTPVAFFIPIFVLIFLYKTFKDKAIKDKKVIKGAVIAIVLGILVLMPVVSYNYLTYQESGLTDYYVATFLGIGKSLHEGSNLVNQPWAYSKLKSVTKELLVRFIKIDFILLIFGILGAMIAFKSEKLAVTLMVLTVILFHIRVAGQTASDSHYLWHLVILSIFAGLAVTKISYYVKNKFKFKNLIFVVMVVAVISIFLVMEGIIEQREESITLNLRDYVREEISENAVVVIDVRIYSGIHAWVFNDKHYIESMSVKRLIKQIVESSEEKFETDLYYIECGEGTNCGWKPEDFARIYDVAEDISKDFREKLNKVKEIRAGHNFNIYKGKILMTESSYETIDKTHKFWFHPVGWKFPEIAEDNYTPIGIGKFVNFMGFVFLWMDVVLALLVIPFVLWLGFHKKKSRVHNFFK